MAQVQADGSQAATLGTEHTLATITVPGTYELNVNTTPLQAGEVLRLRIYGKVLSTSSETLIHEATFRAGGPITQPASPAKMSPHHFRATLMQTGGTGRTFEWSVVKP